jgi:hypothetical protein
VRFYTRQHRHYCGIDLHARSLYVCILDQTGQVLVHQNLRASPEELLAAVAAYRDDLVIAVECIFTWYWVADLCAQEGIAFVLGHALYMKAIHGGKTKNDRIDALKIATLLRAGSSPRIARRLTRGDSSRVAGRGVSLCCAPRSRVGVGCKPLREARGIPACPSAGHLVARRVWPQPRSLRAL